MLRSTKIRASIRGNSDPLLSKPAGLHISLTSRLILRVARSEELQSMLQRGTEEPELIRVSCFNSKWCLLLSLMVYAQECGTHCS